MKNPKSEIRNPNEAPSAKSQKVDPAARSVLDCGSPLLLCRRTGKDEGRVTRPPEFPARPGESARGLAHSKTWRLIGARNFVVPSTTGLAPTLFIQLSGNSVIVSWPSPSTGFVLRQSASLGIPVWSEVVQAPGDNGTIKGVTLTLSLGGTFYRLMKP